MAHKKSQVIVWEWETNDTGTFVPYDELSSNLIEMKFSSGMLSVDLSQLGASYSAWTVNLTTMQQRSSYLGRQRSIRRKSYPGNSLIAYGIVWEFISDLDWQQFDVKTSAIIEDNYNDGRTCLDMKQLNSLPMTIDFSSMTVKNHQNMSFKRIRRRTLQVPYIGGSIGPIPRSVVMQQAQFKKAKKKLMKKKIFKECDGNIIVWEKETDIQGVFAPYSETDSNAIETDYAAGKKNIVIRTHHHRIVTIDVISMKATINQTGTECFIRRELYPKDVPIANGISWEWKGDEDWELYNVDASAQIEDKYQKGNTTLNMRQTSLCIPNTISFTMMHQKNDIFGTQRQIRRRQMNMSYSEEQSASQKSRKPNIKEVRKTRHSDSMNVNGLLLSDEALSDEMAPDRSEDDAEFHELAGISESDNVEAEDEAVEMQSQPTTYRLRGVAVAHPVLKQFCKPCDSVEADEECSICLYELREHPEDIGATSDNSVVELNKCHHRFHECCLGRFYDSGNKGGSIQCPICKSIHGTKTGNQPPGTMTTQRMSQSIPGYPGCGCIQITYNIHGGVQGQGHPNPGQPYHVYGFPRVAYLPDNTKGNKVLQLLKEAWNRKLIFTVGTSVTSGTQNAVVWNEIHHKTEGFSNTSGHGYPDPNYLDNVLGELKVHGVE